MYPPIHQIFNCYGYQFCLHFQAFHLETAPVYRAFIRFMGDDHDAKKFTYTSEVDHDAKNFTYTLEVGSSGKKMTWQGIPRSIRDSRTRVRDSVDGLIIQRNMALFFSGS